MADEGASAVIAAYLEAEDLGQQPDRSDWLRRYPKFDKELRVFFQDHDRMLRADPGPRLEATPTLCMAGSAAPARLATKLGDYEVLEELARGGMGVVCKARQISLNRIVAVKVILSGAFATEDVIRFRAEAESAALLDHPNIVPIYEIGEYDGRPFFSMKLIEGGSLGQRREEYLFQPRKAVPLLLQVARAVHYAHQHGILHRDLKPGNILLDAAGVPYLTDFGLAKRLHDESDLTRTGMIVGTPNYMAPEQAAGTKQLTTAADIFSLGAIFYEMLTGRKPFQSDDPLQTLLMVRECEPARPTSLNRLVNVDLETICLKCLRKEPTARYASAEHLASDLDNWLRGNPIAARPYSRTERLFLWLRRRPALTAAALSAAVFVVVSFAAMFVLWRDAVEQGRLAAEARDEATSLASAEARQRQEAERAREGESKQLERYRRGEYLGMIEAARKEVAADRIASAEAILDNCSADLRDWEWRWLRSQCPRTSNYPGKLPRISPDGRTLAYVTPTGVELCDWATQARRAFFPARDAHDLAFSNDGEVLAVASDTGLTLYRIGEDRPIFEHKEKVVCFALIPNTTRILVGSKETLSVLDWKSKEKEKLTYAQPRLRFCAVHPDGKTFATAGDRLRLWRLGEERAFREVDCVCNFRLAFAPDGRLLYTAGNRVLLLDSANDQEPVALEGLTREVAFVAASPCGTMVAACGGPDGVCMWNRDGQLLRRTISQSMVLDVAFHPNGNDAVTCSHSECRVWTITKPPLVLETKDRGQTFALSGNGARLVFIGDKGAHLWDVQAAKIIRKLSCVPVGDAWYFVDVRGSTMTVVAKDGNVLRCDLDADRELKRFDVRKPLQAAAISPDGDELLLGVSPKSIRRYLIDGTEAGTFNTGQAGRVQQLAWTSKGRCALVDVPSAKDLCVWNLDEDKEFARVTCDSSAAFLRPDGSGLAGLETDPKLTRTDVLLFDLDGKPTARMSGHSSFVSSLMFTPDGKRLVSAGVDGSVRLWDVRTGQLALQLAEGIGWIMQVAVSADGQSIAIRGMDGKLRIWRAPKE